MAQVIAFVDFKLVHAHPEKQARSVNKLRINENKKSRAVKINNSQENLKSPYKSRIWPRYIIKNTYLHGWILNLGDLSWLKTHDKVKLLIHPEQTEGTSLITRSGNVKKCPRRMCQHLRTF